MTRFLKSLIKLALYVFPNGVTVRAYHHSAFYRSVVYELCFQNYVGVPLGEVLVNIGYFFYEFVSLCHTVYAPFAHSAFFAFIYIV